MEILVLTVAIIGDYLLIKAIYDYHCKLANMPVREDNKPVNKNNECFANECFVEDFFYSGIRITA